MQGCLPSPGFPYGEGKSGVSDRPLGREGAPCDRPSVKEAGE